MSEPIRVDADDPTGNNSVATGALLTALHMASAQSINRIEIVGGNQLVVAFDFLGSPYLVTVERIKADDEQ